MYLCTVMNEVLISIGSNINKEKNLAVCQQLLNASFDCIHYSDISITVPYGNNYQDNFINQLAMILTNDEKNVVSNILKSIEKKIGRVPEDKNLGIVKIDVDIIIWNNNVIKTEDITRSYVKDLISTLPSVDNLKYLNL